MTFQSIRIQTEQKRLLRKSSAAGYCDLSVPKFDRTCPVRPVELQCGDERYDVHDLDLWIDSLKGGSQAFAHDEIVGKLE